MTASPAPARAPSRRLVALLRLLGSALLTPTLLISALLMPMVVAGCADSGGPEDFKPLTFDYLAKMRLTVASVDVDSAWTSKPVPGAAHVEAMAPVQPADALRRMAQDRLIPASTTGHAVFVIDDASIVGFPDRYEGNLAVHLDISTSDGTRSGYAEARVTRTRSIVDHSAAATRASLYELVRQMMGDMNVEFEFQVRRSLRDYLQGATETAPAPAPVDQQDLTPGGAPPMPTAAPGPATPTPQPAPPNAMAPQPVPPDAMTPQPAPPGAMTPQPAPPGAMTPQPAPPGAMTPQPAPSGAITPQPAPPDAITPQPTPQPTMPTNPSL